LGALCRRKPDARRGADQPILFGVGVSQISAFGTRHEVIFHLAALVGAPFVRAQR
jgi:hypothetical protein